MATAPGQLILHVGQDVGISVQGDSEAGVAQEKPFAQEVIRVLFPPIEKGHRTMQTMTLRLEVSKAQRQAIPKPTAGNAGPGLTQCNPRESRALLLSGLFS